MNNVKKCFKCGLSLIQEELKNHLCNTNNPQSYQFDTDNDFIEIFDGLRWIPIKSKFPYQPTGNTKNYQPKRKQNPK